MSVFDNASFEHEQVTFVHDASAGLRLIIAIHTTSPFGTSGGGCRMCTYASEDAALNDVLRLSRAMSFKLALLDMPAGGAKAVIIGDPRQDKSQALLRALGRAVERLGGRFVIAQDVGMTPADMRVIASETKYVMGRRTSTAVATAHGVLLGLREAVRRRLGRDDLRGVSVAIQGIGEVGLQLGRELARAGAELAVADLDPAKVQRAVRELGARAVRVDEILSCDVDVLAPCALGGVFDDSSIPTLRCAVIAGSANNQLAEDRHAEALAERGILLAPDFIINAGGIIAAWQQGPAGAGESDDRVRSEVERLAPLLESVFECAERERVTPYAVGIRMARERLRGG